jgi:hypothetical protein
MTQNFVTTFLFESQYPTVYQELQVVGQKVFVEAPSLPLEQEEDELTAPLQKLQGCYNINAFEDDDPRNVNITKTEGHRDIEGPRVELHFIGQPIKIKKVNIGIEKTQNLQMLEIIGMPPLLTRSQIYYMSIRTCFQPS